MLIEDKIEKLEKWVGELSAYNRRLQEQIEAVTRERDHWKLTASVESGKVAFRDSRFATLDARAEAAEARAARLEAALREYENPSNWGVNCRFDANSPRFEGTSFAHAALDEKKVEQ